MASSPERFLEALKAGAWSRVADLRQGVLFTLGAILVYRLGTYIPVPGVNAGFMAALLNEHRNDALGLLDVFTGGAVRRFSVFTVHIVPYVTALALIKAATPFSPRLTALKEQGLSGARRINQYGMLLAAVLSLILSYRVAVALEGAHNAFGPAVSRPGGLFLVSCTVTMTGGSLFLTWLAHDINERGIGLGFSGPGNGLGFVLIGTSGLFVSMPQALASVPAFGRSMGLPSYMPWALLPAAIVLVTFITFFEQSQRRLPVDSPRRTPGKRSFGTGSYLPIRANPAGIGPSATAASILLTPVTLCGFLSPASPVRQFFEGPFARGQPLYLAAYAIAVVVIAFITVPQNFDVAKVAQKFRETGEFIPGYRPGQATAAYVGQVLRRMTAVGMLYLCLVCVPLEWLIGRYGLAEAFVGAAIIGMVTLIVQIIEHLAFLATPALYDGFIQTSRRRK